MNIRNFMFAKLKFIPTKTFTGLFLIVVMVFSALGPGIFAVNEIFAAPPAQVDFCHVPEGNTENAQLFLDQPIDSWTKAHSGQHSFDFLIENQDDLERCQALINGGEPKAPKLTVKKIVVGGTAVPSDFSMIVNSVGANPAGQFPGSTEGTVVTLVAGEPYGVGESLKPGYKGSFSEDCAGTMLAGQEKTCIVTNTYTPEEPPQEEPENSCVIPDPLQDSSTISFGVSPEKTLQQILDEEYGLNTIDAVNDETNIQVWNIPVGTASVTFTATEIASLAGYTNTLGYYTDSDLSTIVPVVYGVPTVVNTTGISSLGFVLISDTGSEPEVINEYATEKSLNGGNDQAVVYNHADDTYVIAFEDKPVSGPDKDYNDLVVEVVINDCTEVLAVCEPGKELIVNGSFEEPVVTNGAKWDVFGSVLGWSFDWMNTEGAPEPVLELHRGVSGWVSAEGSQHAELDGDWFGPSNSSQGGSTKLWQEIATVPGKEYELKFSFSARPNTQEADNKLGVKINGTDIFGSPFTKSNNTNQTAWEEFTHKFTATSALTKIKFEDRGTENALGTFLDDVSVMCLEECVETSGSIVSGTNTKVKDIDGTEQNYGAFEVTHTNITNTYWTADDGGDFGAGKWVWSEDPVTGWTVDKVVTFEEQFTIVGDPQSAHIFVAADNDYEVFVNENSVGSNATLNQGHVAPPGSFVIDPSLLSNGVNTLKVVVTNKGQGGESVNNPGGLIYNLTWTAEDCGNNPPDDPEEIKYDVTFHKFIDGEVATVGEFEIEYGTPIFNGQKFVLESSNSFSETIEVVANETLAWSETTGGESGVLPLGTQCTAGNYGKYILKGYTFANLFDEAKNLSPDSNASAVISLNSHVIVWNEYCPEPTIEISAIKIECTDEALLPNWGAGNVVGLIGESTASDWLNDTNHPKRQQSCKLVPWDFQWAPAGTSNPGDETEYAGNPWTTFSGNTSISLSNLNGSYIWVREALKSGYIGFGGQNTTQNVSAEFYCHDDVLNYDNYEWIGQASPLVAGTTYYCVGWNVPENPTIPEDPQDPPTITTTSTGGGGGGSSSSRRQNPPLVLGASSENPGEVLGATIGLPNTGRAEESTSSTNSLIALFAVSIIGLVALNFRSLKPQK